MPYKLNINLSMLIDENSKEQSIEEICDILKKSFDYSKEKESKQFDIDINLSFL